MKRNMNFAAENYKNQAEVEIKNCTLPETLDVSACHTILLNDTDVSDVKKIIFRDKQQVANSGVYIPEDWQGEILLSGSASEDVKNTDKLPKIKFDIPAFEDKD